MGLIDTFAPAYKITANDKDITAAIASRFVELRITDETGFESDSLEVVLSDTDPNNPVKIPPTGAELHVWIGYRGQLVDKGVFICDEVELSGWPGVMVLRARAAPFDQTPKGKVDMQSQKTRSWPEGTTIGGMVKQIATEHGMTAATSSELAGVKLPHIDQSDESDMNFLVRLARKYDAIAKPAGGKLIFAKRGNAKKVSGADLPTVTLTPVDVSDFRLTIARRDSPGTVVAFYRDTRGAARHQVSQGQGVPVRRIRMGFKNREMAQAAVEAELARRARGSFRLTVSGTGRPDLGAEASLQMVGFRDGVAGAWLVTRAEHELSARDGYRCYIEAEKPNSDPDVEEVTGGEIRDVASPK